MDVVMITQDCAPVAKVGGLGDVAQGLSYELPVRGNDVELILPKYDSMRYDKIRDSLPRLADGADQPFAPAPQFILRTTAGSSNQETHSQTPAPAV